jgi:hypothetical protein
MEDQLSLSLKNIVNNNFDGGDVQLIAEAIQSDKMKLLSPLDGIKITGDVNKSIIILGNNNIIISNDSAQKIKESLDNLDRRRKNNDRQFFEKLDLEEREKLQQMLLDLEQYLSINQWRRANFITRQIFLEICDQEKNGWITNEQIQRFPCPVLKRIDQLWTDASGAKFGFSCQKQILNSCGLVPKKFGEEVGWFSDGLWISDSKVIYDLKAAPPGHLPWSFLPVVEVDNALLNAFLIGFLAVNKLLVKKAWQRQLIVDFISLPACLTGNEIDKEEVKRNLERELSQREPWWSENKIQEERIIRLFALLKLC